MVRTIAMLLKKYFPAGIYTRAEKIYNFSKKPVLKKWVMDSPLLAKFCQDRTYPEELFIFLTTRCNIRCLICRREEHQPIDLKLEDLDKLKEAITHARVIDLTGWGEPFLYRNFVEVINYVVENNKKTDVIRITTNGTLLSEKYGRLLNGRLNRLTISLNAATKATYNQDMQYSDYDSVIANIGQFMTALSPETRGKIYLHFVAHIGNYREIPEFVRLADSLGIRNISIGNYIISTEDHIPLALVHAKEEYNAVIAEAERLALAQGIFFNARRFGVENDPDLFSLHCFYPYTQLFVQPDGEVTGPCCHGGTYPLGNVYREGFAAVWWSEKYRRLRASRHLSACRTCTAYSPFDSLDTHFDSAFLRSHKAAVEKFLAGETS